TDLEVSLLRYSVPVKFGTWSSCRGVRQLPHGAGNMYRCSTSTNSSLRQSFEWPRQLRGCRMSTSVASTSIRNRETSKIYLHHQLRLKAVFGCHNKNLSSPIQHKSVEPCHPLHLNHHAPIGSRFTTKTTTDDGSAVAVRGFHFTRSPRYLCLNPEMGNY
ncbi:hypothetical protein CNYM01_13951, partial [Colletotrichum nymphaeae SA-01]